MGGGIVVAQLQREGIGPAARLGDLPGREIASRDRHLHRLFGHARSVGGIAQLRLRIVRKGAGSRAERLPEILKGIFFGQDRSAPRSEEHTSELQSLMRISYAVFCLNKKTEYTTQLHHASRIV